MTIEQENTAPETIVEPEAEVETNPLAQEVQDLKEEVVTLKNTILRSEADKENLRKRLAKELEDMAKYAVSGFAQDLIEVLENLYRAEDALQADMLSANPGLQSFVDGIILTRNSLIDVFAKHGITRIYPENEQFDHHLHQAISQVESNEHAPGVIINVVQAGYKLKERLLRPAMVVVAKEAAQTMEA